MDTTIEEAIAGLEEALSSAKDSLLLLKLVLDKEAGTNIINQETLAKTIDLTEIRF
jgi:hypothetical protein